jgi:hypothetical protein
MQQLAAKQRRQGLDGHQIALAGVAPLALADGDTGRAPRCAAP